MSALYRTQFETRTVASAADTREDSPSDCLADSQELKYPSLAPHVDASNTSCMESQGFCILSVRYPLEQTELPRLVDISPSFL